MAGQSEFQRGRASVLKQASDIAAKADERIARQWDTIDTLMAYLTETKQIDKFNRWADKGDHRSTKHHDDWKKTQES